MATLKIAIAALLLLGFCAIVTRLRGAEFGERILVYETASLLLVSVLLMTGSAGGVEAAQYIALLFLAVSVISGYALILLYWMLAGDEEGEGDDR